MFGMWNVRDPKFSKCGMMEIWDGGDMVCWVVRCW